MTKLTSIACRAAVLGSLALLAAGCEANPQVGYVFSEYTYDARPGSTSAIATTDVRPSSPAQTKAN